jgi:hypothetical protein
MIHFSVLALPSSPAGEGGVRAAEEAEVASISSDNLLDRTLARSTIVDVRSQRVHRGSQS